MYKLVKSSTLERPFQPLHKPILPELVTAGGTVLGSLLGGIFGSSGQSSANRTNLQIARETNAQNYKMFQEQLGFTEDMWNKSNAYNTPRAQRQRYLDAGINPYLAMTQSDEGNTVASATPAPAAAVTGAPMQNALAPFAEGIGNAASSALANIGIALSNKEKAIDLQTRHVQNLADINQKLKAGVLSDSQARLALANEHRIGQMLPIDMENGLAGIGLTRAQTNEALEQSQLIALQRKVNEYELSHIKPAQLRQINAEINALAEDVRSRRISANAAASQAETALKQFGLKENEQRVLLPFMRDEINSRIRLNEYNSSPETVTEFNSNVDTDGGSSKFGPISSTRPSVKSSFHRVTRSRGRK